MTTSQHFCVASGANAGRTDHAKHNIAGIQAETATFCGHADTLGILRLPTYV